MKLKDLFRTKKPADISAGREVKFNTPVSGKNIQDVFKDCYDFEIRTLRLGGYDREVTLCFIDGLISGNTIAEQVIRPLTSALRFAPDISTPEAVAKMLGGAVYVYTVKERSSTQDTAGDMLNGYCAIIFEKEKTALTFEVKTGDKRSIDQPKEEKVVKGSKDAFIEIMKTNTMLVRRKIKDPNLKIKKMTIGERSNTDVCVIYIDGYTNSDIVNEVERRIKAIDAADAITAGCLEENLVDDPKTPFPQLINTERPDKFAMNIIEGRVGVLIDGLPMGFLAPGTFAQFMKVPEDQANHFIVASALTLLRYLCIVITLFLPALYVATAMYHQEMMPVKLLQSIINSKESVPFPTAFEVIAMLIAFETLQEAGLHLSNPIGQTVSIIGALVVGQAAVDAKVVSPAVVIVIAIAGITGYAMPNQDMSAALRLCRFLLVLAGITAGVYGIMLGSAMIIYHLCSLESFGVAYMTPFADSKGKHMMRALLRRPMTEKRAREPALVPDGGGKQ